MILTACLECHDAAVIVQQRLSKAAWTKEVDKMISGVRWSNQLTEIPSSTTSA